MGTGLLLQDKGIVLIASESAYNTNAVAAAIVANGPLTYVAVHDDMKPSLEVVSYVPNQLLPSAGGNEHKVFVNSSKLAGTFPMRAGVGATFIPHWLPFAKAANFAVVSAGSSTVMSLSTTQQQAMSFHRYDRDSETGDYQLSPVTGVRGNLSFALELEKEPIATFTGMGASAEDASAYRAYFTAAGKPAFNYAGGTVTNTSTVTRDTAGRFGCQAMTLTVGGVNYPAMSMNMDLGWTPTPVSTLQSSPTVSKVLLTKNNTTRTSGNIVLMDGLTALADARAKWASGAKASLVAVCSNGVEKMTIEAENIQLGYHTEQAQGGVRGFGVPFFVVQSNTGTSIFGDSWVKITMAAA